MKPAEVRAEVDKVIQYSEDQMRVASQRLARGSLDIGGWQDLMVDNLKALHLASAASANGGFANLTRDDIARVAGQLTNEYGYLQNFAGQLESGAQALDERMAQRVDMFVNSARTTYEDQRRDNMGQAGFDEERNVEDPGANHCGECGELSDSGWVPIGTLPLPGDRECLQNCRCTLEYRGGGVEEE